MRRSDENNNFAERQAKLDNAKKKRIEVMENRLSA
jgi:hypothetical protein